MKLQRRLTPNALHLTPNSAFSLIELSIVLLIISVMVVGIVKGGHLVSLARLMNARSFTSNSPVPKISGLLAWYETSMKASLSESEVYEDAPITAWYDISPNSIANQRNTLTLMGQALAPAPVCAIGDSCTINTITPITYQPDGIGKLPSLKFNGTGPLTLPDFYQGSLRQRTIFVVAKLTSWGGGAVELFDYTCGGSTYFADLYLSPSSIYTGSALFGTSTNPANISIGKDILIVAYINGSSTKLYQNNGGTDNVGAMIGGGAVTGPSVDSKGLTIGADRCNVGPYGFVGLISEVIVYNRPLKLQERKDVMSYLSKKYQITVTGL